MKLGIMQPYFFPYIGYWQLINAVDTFVVYDNIQFTKKGWIHRNRILVNGEPFLFSLPLKGGSDFWDVRERKLADTWPLEKEKLIRRFEAAYKKAPFFSETMPLVKKSLNQTSQNLFDFIYFSIELLADYLEIKSNIIVSSSLDMNHNLKSQDRVIEICKNTSASIYINPIGGKDLYEKTVFRKGGIDLLFLKANTTEYKQFNTPFVPSLSIIDVLMFNSIKDTRSMLMDYSLL